MSQLALVVKNPPASAGDVRDLGSVPGSGGSPGGVHGNPLQYSCLENPIDSEAWQATVHGVTKCWTQLYVSTHTYILTYTDLQNFIFIVIKRSLSIRPKGFPYI